MDKGRYFIALIPPAEIFSEIEAFKQEFSDKYRSKAALRSPPHITLHMPFLWNPEKIERVHHVMQKTAARSFSAAGSFEISLINFDHFDNRVIYVNVVPSAELLELQNQVAEAAKKELNLFHADHRDRPYHPHMTVGFRDLRPSEFIKAWEDFKNRQYEKRFRCSSFSLMKWNGKRWEEMEKYPSTAS